MTSQAQYACALDGARTVWRQGLQKSQPSAIAPKPPHTTRTGIHRTRFNPPPRRKRTHRTHFTRAHRPGLVLLLLAATWTRTPLIVASFPVDDRIGGAPHQESAHGLGGVTLKVHVLRISARYNFNLLRNKWFPTSPTRIRTLYPVPATWSPTPRKTAKRMAQAARIGGPYLLELPRYPATHAMHQHAAEYYLTLSLLTGVPGVTAVGSFEEADIIFVPFFSSISYHMSHSHRKATDALVTELLASPSWARSNGTDHVIPGVHPNALLRLWGVLPTARFLFVDLSSPPEEVAHLDKDIPVPYASAIAPSPIEDAESAAAGWNARHQLLFFRGNTARKKNGNFVRAGLGRALKGEGGVVFQNAKLKWRGDATASAEAMMRSSKFCLAPEGDTTSSCRLYDAILAGCIPVVVSDDVDLPFEEHVDYTRFALFVPTALAHREGYLVGLLRAINETRWRSMHSALLQVQQHFRFSVPAASNGAEEMVWRSLAARANQALDWRNRRRRHAAMVQMLEEAGLSQRDWVARPRGAV